MRTKFMIWLYSWSQELYRYLFKGNTRAWALKKDDLLIYPENSLGRKLGEFFNENNFEIMKKFENHDVFHVIINYGTKIQDEVAMQYYLMGNGKRSVYMFSMILIGTILFPEYYKYYTKSFKEGKNVGKFWNINFENELKNDINSIREKFQILIK